MALDLVAARRFGRQVAVAGFGSDGQARAMAATVVLAGGGGAIETAHRYLAAAGVTRARLVTRGPMSALPWPSDGEAWMAVLAGASLAIRSGFDDDAMLRAAVRLGVPMIVVRAGPGGVDLVSLRRHGPCPHLSLDVPERQATVRAPDPAAEVLAGALAASEALWILARPREAESGESARARVLRLPLGPGSDPVAHDLPWAPECFACGGQATEALPA